MNRKDSTVRALLASAVLLAQLTAPFTRTNAFASSAVGTPQDDVASPAAVEPAPVGLADFDVRRDPETLEINAGTARKAAARTASPRAIDAIRASAPGSPNAVRVALSPSGVAHYVVDDDGPLTKPAQGTPDRIARTFLARNAELFGLTAAAVRRLKLTMNHLDDTCGATFLKYEQRVGAVSVFDSEISVSVTANGEVITATAGELVADAAAAPEATLGQDEAIAKAFELCGAAAPAGALEARAEKTADGMTAYANPIDASLEDVRAGRSLVNVLGETRAAYRVSIDKGGSEWYDTLVDANSGELIYRHNLYSDAQGLVFKESPRFARTEETLAPSNFLGSPIGDAWLTGNVTTGNNVDAYLDTNDDNKPDRTTSPLLSNGRAKASVSGDFNYSFQNDVDPRGEQPASVTNLFYNVNVMHDWMYSLGFTETARNFQTSNFGRGGSGGDAVRAESQDGGGMNNADFGTPSDGNAPRMQMYLWHTEGEPAFEDRDGSFDADVVYHEYGHGVSNRLIGNGSGLGGRQSDAMGEGWSDYWAVTTFDSAIAEFSQGNTNGLRRTLYDGRTSAPNGSYAMIGPDGNFGVHSDGEVWCQALVDLRNHLGKDVTDKLVLTGMMHTATHPSMIAARDGILAADQALSHGANACAIWTVFARHGMGFSASGDDGKTHDAAFDLPRQCALSPADNAEIYTTDGNGGILGLNGFTTFRNDWTAIVPGDFGGGDGNTDLFFYEASQGVGEFYTTDPLGHLTLLRQLTGLSRSWDLIVPGEFGGDDHTDLLFYDRETGTGSFYTTDGSGGIHLLSTTTSFRHTWDAIVPGDFGGDTHTDLFFYDRAAGTGEFWATNGAGGITLIQSLGGFRTTWTQIVPGSFGGDGHTDLFLYDRAAGLGEFFTTDGRGNISLLRIQPSLRASWDIVVPGSFGGDSFTDLLFYDRSAGFAQFYATDGGGGIQHLSDHAEFRPTWSLIVPGAFGDDYHTDLLFYQR